ncbi:carboxylesterase/lipase family protein [Parvularcula sp. LCG005]|uniref:carboxylesterase/lipase family protein n=1 Tax=Parvularcula sp. LCG005 TaxID=3078805 RepID=UPI0029426ED8|nr:carboxylesterase family protein [Parvularcula sp. LCG005]WOI53277.1 carboxylesterase family protein [Parvularcula sp. LCG005]
MLLTALTSSLFSLLAADPVTVTQGDLVGQAANDQGVTAYLGIPYAAAPLDDLRFAPPQPAPAWEGTRDATSFGDRCMQQPLYGDMIFRSDAVSEDCLYLNVWTPEGAATDAALPILFYIHGGGFVTGSGDEPRYDGAALASQGVVVVTVNYRLGAFGFMAHPDLDGGNAALFDLAMALDWVRQNAKAFGGDPARITIGGESAGSFAVSALLASPVTQDHVAGALAQSGSIAGMTPPALEAAQADGAALGAAMEAPDLAALRSLPADAVLETAAKMRFWPSMDGTFLTSNPRDAFETGEVANVPVMVGVTSAEMSSGAMLQGGPATVDNFTTQLKNRFGDKADSVYAAYGSPMTDAEVLRAARDLASDSFIGAGTMRMAAAMSETGRPVYAYLFDQARPAPKEGTGGWTSPEGAGHSTDIEYFLGTQELAEDVYDWTAADKDLSGLMQAYVVNFLNTGDPNGGKLPAWPDMSEGQRLVLKPSPTTEPVEPVLNRIDAVAAASPAAGN